MHAQKPDKKSNFTLLFLVIIITVIFFAVPAYTLYDFGMIVEYEEFVKPGAIYLFCAVIITFFAIRYAFSHLIKREIIEKNRVLESVNILKKQKEDIVSEKKALEENMKIREEEHKKEKLYFKNSSLVDEETGFYSQDYFYKILSDEINRARRDKKQLMLAYLEIGDGKDTTAYNAQDAIEIIGKEITKCAKRAADFSFRVDRFRFAVLLSGLSLDNSKRFINFIKENIDAKKIELDPEATEDFMVVSVGVAISFSEALPLVQEFEQKAFNALNRAKEGKDEKVVFEVIE